MTIKELTKEMKKKNANLEKILEVRTYIPIAEKKAILETVLDKYSVVEDGVLTCDYVTKKITFELAMIKYHTNLEIDITSEDDYDEIRKADINIRGFCAIDYEECKLLLEGMEKELRSQYSIETSIIHLSNQISENIDGLVKLVSQKIDGFDMSKFGFKGKELDQLKVLLNKYGK